jgi:hypothetical protein
MSMRLATLATLVTLLLGFFLGFAVHSTAHAQASTTVTAGATGIRGSSTGLSYTVEEVKVGGSCVIIVSGTQGAGPMKFYGTTPCH